MRAVLVLTLALPFSLASCGGDDDVIPDGSLFPPDTGVLPDADPPDAELSPDASGIDAGPCVTFGGTVKEDDPTIGDFMLLPPAVGVTVTAFQGMTPIDSTETANDGGFALCVPPSASIVILVQKAGFGSYAYLKVTGQPNGLYLAVRHFHDSFADAFWGSFGGATYPSATTGFVTMSTFVNPATFGLAGVSATLAPAPGGGPYYYDAEYTYQPTLTETTTGGIMAAANIPTGMVTIQLDHDTLTCHELHGGFAGPTAESVRVPVFANTETVLDVTCD